MKFRGNVKIPWKRRQKVLSSNILDYNFLTIYISVKCALDVGLDCSAKFGGGYLRLASSPLPIKHPHAAGWIS